jgi:hypothetical protein
MLKILLTPSPEQSECVWCQSRKRHTVTVDFSNGFLRSKPMCFECLERAARVQLAAEAVARPEDGAAATPEVKSRKDSGV